VTTTADRFDEAYDEREFAWLLSMEQRRSERSQTASALLLVDLEALPGLTSEPDPSDAARLFTILRGCLRRTDTVGWYRQDSVLGALLAGSRSRPSVSALDAIRQRVADALASSSAPGITRRLRVRVRPELESQHTSLSGVLTSPRTERARI
jgi:hypothetical protein